MKAATLVSLKAKAAGVGALAAFWCYSKTGCISNADFTRVGL